MLADPVLSGLSEPSEEFLRSFVDSMPRHYRGFEASTVQAHATIAFERGNAQVRVGVWRKLTGGGVAICIAALIDRGCLSLVAAALTAHDLDIIAAQIYTRDPRAVSAKRSICSGCGAARWREAAARSPAKK